MSELSNKTWASHGLVTCVVVVGLLIADASVNPTLAQECDKVGGKLGGAVIGGATGSMFGKGKGRKGAVIGGALLGGALGARRDQRDKARCLEERRAEKDRDMQRQLDYNRQRLLQEEQVRKEIEEHRLYEEWKRERIGSSN